MNEWKDDLVSSLRAHSLRDDAIDPSASDLDGYVTTRNPALLAALPGMRLVTAVLKPLPVSVSLQIDSLASYQAKALQAFRVSCSAIENFGGDIGALMPTGHARLADGQEHVVWSQAELDMVSVQYGKWFIYEFGGVALERSEPGKSWGGGVTYTLPQYLEAALTRLKLQRAASILAKRGTTSKKESPRESQPTSA